MINVLNSNLLLDSFYSPCVSEAGEAEACSAGYREICSRLPPSGLSQGAGPTDWPIFWGVQRYLTFLILCPMVPTVQDYYKD